MNADGATRRDQALAALALLVVFFVMDPLAAALAPRWSLGWYAARAVTLGLAFAALFASHPAWRRSTPLRERFGRGPVSIAAGLLAGALTIGLARLVRELAS